MGKAGVQARQTHSMRLAGRCHRRLHPLHCQSTPRHTTHLLPLPPLGQNLSPLLVGLVLAGLASGGSRTALTSILWPLSGSSGFSLR